MIPLLLLACHAPPPPDTGGGPAGEPAVGGDSAPERVPDPPADTAADTGPPDTGDTGAPPEEDPSEWWFGRAHVRQIDLTLGEEEWVALVRDPHTYVSATAVVEGQLLGEIGLHLKGSSTFEPITDKPNFKLKFTWDDPDQEVHGLRRIELHNFHHDAARAAEYVASHFLRGQGIPAPRFGFAQVTLNGEDYGFYGVSEAYDEQFIARSFPDDPDGNLYSHPAEVRCDLDSYDCLERNETGSVDDGSDLEALNAAANLPDDEALPALLALFDRELLMEYLAAERVLGHWDSYSGNANNYYLYYRPSTGTWQLVLHSLDTAWAGLWGGPYDGGTRTFYGCGDFRPDPDDLYDRARLSELCVHDEACIGEVAARAAELADALEASDTVAEAEALLAWIDPYVLADPKRQMDDEQHREAVECFREWLPGRPDGVRHWLARRDEGVLVATDAATYAPGAPIAVSFDHLQGDSDDDIRLTDTRSGATVDWRYPDGSQEGATRHVYAGTLTFADGLPRGEYAAEVRFEDRPNPVATTRFRVE